MSELSDLEKICVISFDEMKINKAFLYDKANDEVLKPFSYAQVVMMRSLFGNWKQPVFYDYDFKMTKEALFDLINYLELSGIFTF